MDVYDDYYDGIIGIMMMMKINFLSGTMVIRNERFRKQRLRKNSCLLLGIHQDIGIGVCQKMKKKKQKNYGHKHETFFVSDDRIQKLFDPKRIKSKDLSEESFSLASW